MACRTEQSEVAFLSKKAKRAVVRCVANVILPVMVSVLASCSGKVEDRQPIYHDSPAVADHADVTESIRALDQFFSEWEGTPYRKGGMDQRGIDCSGFVQQTYHTLFGTAIPRTTRLQARLGRAVNPSDLKPTDLVFFKTGFLGRHVGIYRGNGQFMHVSTIRGVCLSHLGNIYWKDHFWQARRILQ